MRLLHDADGVPLGPFGPKEPMVARRAMVAEMREVATSPVETVRLTTAIRVLDDWIKGDEDGEEERLQNEEPQDAL